MDIPIIAESIRFSNPAPKEGENVKVSVVLYNNSSESINFVVIFYWCPEMVVSKEQLKKYAKEEFKVHQEKIKMYGKERKNFSFNWSARKGFKCMFFLLKEFGEEKGCEEESL